MNRKKRLLILKFTLYVCLTVLLYCLQTTPFLLEIYGTRPLLCFSFALCVAIFEGSVAGGFFGFFCGILLDFTSNMLFGMNALICFVCCVGAALLVIFLIRRTIWTALLISAAAAMLRAFVEYYLLYEMWDHAGAGAVFSGRLLPVALYSVIFTLIFYPLVSFIKQKLDFEV